MNSETAIDYFFSLGFEETDIEDGLTALCYELDPAGNYALITDENGAIPASLHHALIFACYNPEGTFLWSASFKNAAVFKEVWTSAPTAEQKLAAIRRHRENNEIFP